ncbi:MAG: 50S ribosomal protein L10 [Pseudomonadota bacterium]
MLRSEKKGFVKELEELYKDSNSVIITHYHGLTVAQITALRRSLRAQGAGFKVVKNTLSKIASRNAEIDGPDQMFSGPTALAYSKDPIAAAKGVTEFAKSNNNLKIICGFIDHHYVDAANVERIAKLPSLDELRGKIIGILQAPATKVAGVVQAPAAQLARLLGAYSTK